MIIIIIIIKYEIVGVIRQKMACFNGKVIIGVLPYDFCF